MNGPDGKLITSPLTLNVDLLDFKSSTKPAGTAKISIFFRPEFVRTPRRSTGTVIGRIGTTIGSVGGGVVGVAGGVVGGGVHGVQTVGKVGIKGVSTVGHGVGSVGKFGIKGVGKGISGVGRGAKRLTGHVRTKSGEVVPIALDDEGRPILDDQGNPLVVDSTTGSLIGSGEALETLVESPGGGGGTAAMNSAPEGTLRIQVGTLNGMEDGEKKAVIIKLNGSKTILETHSHKGDGNGISFNDSTTVKAQAGEPLELEISVM